MQLKQVKSQAAWLINASEAGDMQLGILFQIVETAPLRCVQRQYASKGALLSCRWRWAAQSCSSQSLFASFS